MASFLDLFGDKWTMLILRDLAFHQKKHYKDFMRSDEGISSNILATRLRKLESMGLITKELDPKNASQVIYTMTDKAWTMAPVFQSVAEWSSQHIAETREIDFGFVNNNS